MTCDQVLSSLVNGSALARWRARRHVARCVQCTQTQIQLQKIARELTDAPPLTPAQRALWTAAGTEPVAPSSRPAWLYGAGLLAVTVVVGAIGVMLWLSHFGGKRDGPDSREQIRNRRRRARSSRPIGASSPTKCSPGLIGSNAS